MADNGMEGEMMESLSAISQEFKANHSSEMLLRLLEDSNKGEGEPVVYSFQDPEVRRKLMKLINTDVVRIMDKSFMNNLQEKIYENYCAEFQERLDERRREEKERRKKLALRGIQPLDDNSLEKHPIIQVGREVDRDMEAAKRKIHRPRTHPRSDPWEYRQFQTLSDLESVPSEVSPVEEVIPDRDWLRASERKLAHMTQEAVEIGQLPAPDVIKVLKYEPHFVTELRTLTTVEDLYRKADEILACTLPSIGAPPVDSPIADATVASEAEKTLPDPSATDAPQTTK